jgi:hypothetical protein
MNREAIYTALFSLVSGSASFVTTGRRVKLWSDMNPSDFPALFVNQRDNGYSRGGEHVPAKVTLEADIIIYTSTGLDPNVVPATELNNLLDAIDTALAPSPVPNSRQTLGGLVEHCWIEGQIIVVPGDSDGIGLAMIPVKILVPT